MMAISRLHAACAHLDTHWTFAAFTKCGRTEVEKESDFIRFIAKLKAFEHLRRRSQGRSLCYEDFINAEHKFYEDELKFHDKKGHANG